MRFLLDTHALLWMFSDARRLSAAAAAVIRDPNSDLLFSIASYWEIGIKISLGKLTLSKGWQEKVPAELARNGIKWLAINPTHIHRLAQLPFHHRDPFDRLLVSQAVVEDLSIITKDGLFSDYGINVVW